MGGVIYAGFAYTAGLLTALAFALFVLLMPRGTATLSPLAAVVADVALIVLLGLQHSLMARPAFKRWLTQYVAPPLERSTYLLATVAVFWLLMGHWRFWPLSLWSADGTLAVVLRSLQIAGVVIAVLATFQFDHFRFFGLKPAWESWRQKAVPESGFLTPWLYRQVRHPMMTGFLLLLWCAPQMTADHLLLSLGLSAYILIGVHYEERDLRRSFGATYEAYCRQVPSLLPRLRLPR